MSAQRGTVPGVPAGALFANPRYRVLAERCADGAFLRQPCEVSLDKIASGDRFECELKAINYRCFSPLDGEPYAAWVARRRRDLRREAELLARYKQVSAHVPQIVDVLEGDNTWSEAVVAADLAPGEVCLLLARSPSASLGQLAVPLAQDEAFELAEQLLRLLRVFHREDPRTREARWFLCLTPADVLMDRTTRTFWIDALGKLRSEQELQGEPLFCLPEEQGFVSPNLVPWLPRPRPGHAPPVADSQLADLDLYSVAVIIAWALTPDADFSAKPAGFLGAAHIAALAKERQLGPALVQLLQELAAHRLHTAQAALDLLCSLRQRPRTTFQPPRQLSPRTFTKAPQHQAGEVLGQRYEVRSGLAEGGRGAVYVAADNRTGALVILKVPLHPDLQDAGDAASPLEKVRRRRQEARDEARSALWARARTGSVPQLLDVIEIAPLEPAVVGLKDPAVQQSGDPVLVFELIAGLELNSAQQLDEREVLGIGRAMCAQLMRLHAPDAHGCFALYVDWKPANVLWHPETGRYTLVDLGAVIKVDGGGAKGALFSTNPYAGLEEQVVRNGQRVTNPALGPPFDVHGLGAVLWELAVRPSQTALAGLIARREAHAKAGTSGVIFDPDEVPATHAQLQPILARALQPAPGDRYQSAAAMLADITHALGVLSELPPDPPLALTASLLSSLQIELTCRLPADPFGARLVVCRAPAPIRDHGAPRVHERALAPLAPGETVTLVDALSATWLEAHYAAFVEGRNGQRSPLCSCRVDLLVDPKVAPIERLEKGLRLRWQIPDVVQRHGGQVVVERLAPDARTIYAGSDTECIDRDLDPTIEHRYRIASRLSRGESVGVEVLARPWPVLAHVSDLTTTAGDRRITLRFRMPQDAATELVFVRSQGALTAKDMAEAKHQRHSTVIGLALDARLRVTGAEAPAVLRLGTDGLLHGEWVDEGVRPGVEFCYTPMLRYSDGPASSPGRVWFDAPAFGAAFAEAARVEAVPLSGAVRVRWSCPRQAEGLALSRLPSNGVQAQTWQLPASETAWLDRDVASVRTEYELRVRCGKTWSKGKRVAATPLPQSTRALPRLLATVVDGQVYVSADFHGLGPDARVELRAGAAPETVLVAKAGAHRVHAVLSRSAWPQATLVLREQGQDIEQCEVAAPIAAGNVLVARSVGRMTVDWQPPARSAGALVVAPSAARVSIGQGSVVLANWPVGERASPEATALAVDSDRGPDEVVTVRAFGAEGAPARAVVSAAMVSR